MGAQANKRISQDKGLFPPSSGFSARIWPISRKGGQTLLKPPFVARPLAAAQLNPKLSEKSGKDPPAGSFLTEAQKLAPKGPLCGLIGAFWAILGQKYLPF